MRTKCVKIKIPTDPATGKCEHVYHWAREREWVYAVRARWLLDR